MQIVIDFSLLLGVTIGLVEVVKRLGLNSKFAPVVSIIVGLALSILAFYLKGTELLTTIFAGLIVGLSSVGLFSSVKNVAQGLKGEISG